MNQVVQTRRALNHFICTKLSTHQCTSFQHKRLKKIACILIRENKNPCKIHITPRRTNVSTTPIAILAKVQARL